MKDFKWLRNRVEKLDVHYSEVDTENEVVVLTDVMRLLNSMYNLEGEGIPSYVARWYMSLDGNFYTSLTELLVNIPQDEGERSSFPERETFQWITGDEECNLPVLFHIREKDIIMDFKDEISGMKKYRYLSASKSTVLTIMTPRTLAPTYKGVDRDQLLKVIDKYISEEAGLERLGVLNPKQGKVKVPQWFDDWCKTNILGDRIKLGGNFTQGDLRKLLDIAGGDTMWGFFTEAQTEEVSVNFFKYLRALIIGYEVAEPKYYALIKGHEHIQGEEKYWNYDKENETLEVGRNKVQEDVLTDYTIQATLSEWEDLGVNEDNAEFVKVNE